VGKDLHLAELCLLEECFFSNVELVDEKKPVFCDNAPMSPAIV
jgi:hypothetical protein